MNSETNTISAVSFHTDNFCQDTLQEQQSVLFQQKMLPMIEGHKRNSASWPDTDLNHPH